MARGGAPGFQGEGVADNAPTWMMPGHGLFVGAAAFGVAVVLITEGLSLARRLTPGWLAACLVLAGAIV
jgi:hypothetical protein